MQSDTSGFGWQATNRYTPGKEPKPAGRRVPPEVLQRAKGGCRSCGTYIFSLSAIAISTLAQPTTLGDALISTGLAACLRRANCSRSHLFPMLQSKTRSSPASWSDISNRARAKFLRRRDFLSRTRISSCAPLGVGAHVKPRKMRKLR